MRTHTIQIHDMTIPQLIDSDGNFWPIRPISEAIGLSWQSQVAKLQPPRYTPYERIASIPGQPPMRRLLCLKAQEFKFWLKSLNPRKLSPTAAIRLGHLRAHFLGESPSTSDQSVVTAEATAKVVLTRILNWRLAQIDPATKSALVKDIFERFREDCGFEIFHTQDHQLRRAISALSSILHQHERLSTPSEIPISERVDTIIKSIVDAHAQPANLRDSDFAALLCSIELEQQSQAMPDSLR